MGNQFYFKNTMGPAKGKGGKLGKMGGKSGAKRHTTKAIKETILGITKPAIRRLARRGGVKRISSLIYDETRVVLRHFLENVIQDLPTPNTPRERPSPLSMSSTPSRD